MPTTPGTSQNKDGGGGDPEMGEAPPYRKSMEGGTRPPLPDEEYQDQDLKIHNLKDSLQNHQILRRENENKTRFLGKMDRVYYRIRDLRDILEEDTRSTENVTVSEPPPPPNHKSQENTQLPKPEGAQDSTRSPKKVAVHPPPSPTKYTLTPPPHTVEKSSCYSSNADQSNTLVWVALRYLGTEVHRGTTLGNVELCSELNTADESKCSHPTPTPPATEPPTHTLTSSTRSQNNVTVPDPQPTTPGGYRRTAQKIEKDGKNPKNTKYSKTKIMRKWSETKLTSGNSFSIEKLLQYCEPIRSTRKLAKKPTKSSKNQVKIRKWPPAPPTTLPPKGKTTTPSKKRKFDGKAEENCNNLSKISKKPPSPHPNQKKIRDEPRKMKMTEKFHLDSSTTTPSKFTLQKSKVGNLKEIFENITRVRHSSASRETGQSSSENEIIILKTAIGQYQAAGESDQSESSS